MKKFLCSLAIFSVATIIQVANASSDQSSTSSTSNSKKRIELILVNCNGPHIGYFDDKKGKQHCIAFKNPKEVNYKKINK